MKQFKIAFLLITIGLLVINSTFGQDSLSEKETAIQNQIEELDEIYNLKKKQKEAVRQPVIDFIEKQEALKSLEVSSYTELSSAYSKEYRIFLKKIESLLTEKQIDKKEFSFHHQYKVKSHKKVCITTGNIGRALIEKRMYHHDTILPILMIQRKKLDDKISKKDKKKITKLSKGFIAAKEALHQFEEANQYLISTITGLRNYPKESEMYSRLTYDVYMKRNEIMALISKYDEDITALFEEIEPSMKKWKTAKEAIDYKYNPEKVAREAKWKISTTERIQQAKMEEFKFDFFILDYTIDYSYQNKITVIVKYFSRADSHTIEFELKQSGKIKIELFNNKGELIQLVLSEYRKAGWHFMDIDYLDIKGGDYSYLLTTSDGTEIKVRFLAYMNSY